MVHQTCWDDDDDGVMMNDGGFRPSPTTRRSSFCDRNVKFGSRSSSRGRPVLSTRSASCSNQRMGQLLQHPTNEGSVRRRRSFRDRSRSRSTSRTRNNKKLQHGDEPHHHNGNLLLGKPLDNDINADEETLFAFAPDNWEGGSGNTKSTTLSSSPSSSSSSSNDTPPQSPPKRRSGKLNPPHPQNPQQSPRSSRPSSNNNKPKGMAGRNDFMAQLERAVSARQQKQQQQSPQRRAPPPPQSPMRSRSETMGHMLQQRSPSSRGNSQRRLSQRSLDHHGRQGKQQQQVQSPQPTSPNNDSFRRGTPQRARSHESSLFPLPSPRQSQRVQRTVPVTPVDDFLGSMLEPDEEAMVDESDNNKNNNGNMGLSLFAELSPTPAQQQNVERQFSESFVMAPSTPSFSGDDMESDNLSESSDNLSFDPESDPESDPKNHSQMPMNPYQLLTTTSQEPPFPQSPTQRSSSSASGGGGPMPFPYEVSPAGSRRRGIASPTRRQRSQRFPSRTRSRGRSLRVNQHQSSGSLRGQRSVDRSLTPGKSRPDGSHQHQHQDDLTNSTSLLTLSSGGSLPSDDESDDEMLLPIEPTSVMAELTFIMDGKKSIQNTMPVPPLLHQQEEEGEAMREHTRQGGPAGRMVSPRRSTNPPSRRNHEKHMDKRGPNRGDEDDEEKEEEDIRQRIRKGRRQRSLRSNPSANEKKNAVDDDVTKSARKRRPQSFAGSRAEQ